MHQKFVEKGENYSTVSLILLLNSALMQKLRRIKEFSVKLKITCQQFCKILLLREIFGDAFCLF